jgi:uncharacterized protein (TIRG00374 family)
MFIGLAVFIVYLYFFAGFKNIVVVLQGINPIQYAFFYALAIGSVLLASFFWLLSWRNVLQKLNVRISVKNAFMYYWTGYFVDLVVPCETVCGELTRLYLVHKETDQDYGIVAAGGIANRIIAYIIVVAGLFSSAGLLFLKSHIPSVVLSVLILIMVGATVYLAVLLYLALSEKSAEKIASMGLRILRVLRPKKYRSDELSIETKRSLASFYIGFKTFRERPSYLVKPFVYLAISWVFSLLQYVLVFFALGLSGEPFAFFIIIYFVAGSVTDAAAGFSVGTLDILLATIFVLYGLNPALSGITAALVRSVTFWSPLLIGYAIVQAFGAKKLLAPAPKEKSSSPQNIPPVPPATPTGNTTQPAVGDSREVFVADSETNEK